MSLRVRRLAVVSLAALTLAAGGAAPAVSASALPAQTVNSPGPDSSGGYPNGSGGYPNGPGGHHGHDRPWHFGPFDIPRSGKVHGGFAWDTE